MALAFENSLASLLCSSGKNSTCVDNKRYGALGITRKKNSVPEDKSLRVTLRAHHYLTRFGQG